MKSVFQKFGGIRPMAAKLGGVPASTVKSWHTNRTIPQWRHASILAAAAAHEIELTEAELVNVSADEEEAGPVAANHEAEGAPQEGSAAA